MKDWELQKKYIKNNLRNNNKVCKYNGIILINIIIQSFFIYLFLSLFSFSKVNKIQNVYNNLYELVRMRMRKLLTFGFFIGLFKLFLIKNNIFTTNSISNRTRSNYYK